MTKTSLYSLLRSSSALPKLVVACDESLAEDELKDTLNFWPGDMECLHREGVANYWHNRGNDGIAIFCRRHIFGYKLAACLMMAVKGRVLYVDADVLWFRDPTSFMDMYKRLPLYGTTDIYPSYNDNTLGFLPDALSACLMKPPFVNAGLAIYNREIHEISRFVRYLDAVLLESPVHRFSEQGLVAALVKQSGEVIPNEIICMDHNENSVFLPSFRSKQWFARHYISRSDLRAQFWVDAFWRNLIW